MTEEQETITLELDSSWTDIINEVWEPFHKFSPSETKEDMLEGLLAFHLEETAKKVRRMNEGDPIDKIGSMMLEAGLSPVRVGPSSFIVLKDEK